MATASHPERRRRRRRPVSGRSAGTLAALLLRPSSWLPSAGAFSTFPKTSVPPPAASSSASSLAASAVAGAPLRRELGSQENLMLPRQYGANPDVTFPPMNHVSCAVLAPGSAVPSAAGLRHAVAAVMAAHPLLRATVEGDGEPDARIDLFQMVRKGDNAPCTFVAPRDAADAAFGPDDVLTVVDVPAAGDLAGSWRATFARDLDDGGAWCDVAGGRTPLWKLELHRQADRKAAALVFSFNHAISDQGSANRLTDQILALAADFDMGGRPERKPAAQEIPPSVEESVLGRQQRFKDVAAGGFGPGTVRYVGGKALEETKAPVILPDAAPANQGAGGRIAAALATISGQAAGGEDAAGGARRSVLAFRSLSEEVTERLLEQCRARGVSVTNALSAALTLASTDFVAAGNRNGGKGKARNYKILQSLDMRRFGAALDEGASVGCLAGSMDLMHGPFKDGAGAALLREGRDGGDRIEEFWALAQEGRAQTAAFVDSDGPVHAVRVFDFAMTISDLNNLVHLTAQSKDSQGRAYSAGFTNAGVYERGEAFAYEGEEEGGARGTARTRHGDVQIEDVYYAASNARSGSLYRCSCLTVNGAMKFTFHPAAPLVSAETNEAFADVLLDILRVVSGSDEALASTRGNSDDAARGSDDDGDNSPKLPIPENSLVLAVAAVGAAAVLSHAGAYAQFFASLREMKAHADPADFSAALNFWIFFAVGHPLLQPILWISDVLHGSPGPRVGDLVPATFLLGNAAAIAAVAYVAEIRNAVNVAALLAFLAYVGAGLDGQAGLGDFNLAVDDSYQGKIVKGCPAYEEVRQPSMNAFDLEKYQVRRHLC